MLNIIIIIIIIIIIQIIQILVVYLDVVEAAGVFFFYCFGNLDALESNTRNTWKVLKCGVGKD
jgi:hypothetical protein